LLIRAWLPLLLLSHRGIPFLFFWFNFVAYCDFVEFPSEDDSFLYGTPAAIFLTSDINEIVGLSCLVTYRGLVMSGDLSVVTAGTVLLTLTDVPGELLLSENAPLCFWSFVGFFVTILLIVPFGGGPMRPCSAALVEVALPPL